MPRSACRLMWEGLHVEDEFSLGLENRRLRHFPGEGAAVMAAGSRSVGGSRDPHHPPSRTRLLGGLEPGLGPRAEGGHGGVSPGRLRGQETSSGAQGEGQGPGHVRTARWRHCPEGHWGASEPPCASLCVLSTAPRPHQPWHRRSAALPSSSSGLTWCVLPSHALPPAHTSRPRVTLGRQCVSHVTDASAAWAIPPLVYALGSGPFSVDLPGLPAGPTLRDSQS